MNLTEIRSRQGFVEGTLSGGKFKVHGRYDEGENNRYDGASIPQVALAWLIRHPNVVAIPGASSVEQLRRNVEAADLELADDEAAELTAESDRFTPLKVPATAGAMVRARRRRKRTG